MTNDPLIGKKLANFQIERLLAHGGMADVYYGMDVSLQRPVAIKVIDARFRKNPSYAQRFISEARAMAGWRHENIVQVYYADQQDDLYYFVMEYIDGVSLDALLREYADKGEYMPHDEVLHIGKGVASALTYAHKRGVIHRDIKPPNVMISTDNRIMLMDFGLALDTHHGSMGEVFGTPHYIAPEQARRSADATSLSDVYSLGVMVYEMLTGAVPFDDPSPTSVAILHLSEAPPPPRSLNPELSEQVEVVLLRVLEKDPKQRYASTTEFIQELERVLKLPPAPISMAELPPLPPGMVMPPDRRGWSDSLAERVSVLAQQADSTPQNATSPTKPRPLTLSVRPSPVQEKQERRRRPFPLILLFIAAILGVVILFFTIGMVNNRATADQTSTSVALVNFQATQSVVQQTQTAAAVPDTPTDTDLPPTVTPTLTNTLTETAVLPTEVVVLAPTEPEATVTLTISPVPPTLTETPAPTLTDTPSATPTNTFFPTRTPIRLITNTPEPTITHTPTATFTPSATLTPSPTSLTPTVMYPAGNPIEMQWNLKSFYIYNPNAFSIVVEPLAFEALTADGTPLGYRLEGDRWMIGFPVIEPRKCVAVEFILEIALLQPEQCGGYNAVLTLAPEDSENFWLRRDGATQFRVLWADEEVARCRMADRACEVRLP